MDEFLPSVIAIYSQVACSRTFQNGDGRCLDVRCYGIILNTGDNRPNILS